MTDDKELVERVETAIEVECPFTDQSLTLDEIREIAKVAIAECFRLRPMENAPRDGTRIDLFQGERRVPDCYWHRKAKAWETAHYDREGYSRLRMPFKPTGWLPLPKVGGE